MIHDNDISFAESEVRRMEQELANKKHNNDPKVAEFETILARKKRDLEDLKSRKRREDDQDQRAAAQKKKDDQRLKPF